MTSNFLKQLRGHKTHKKSDIEKLRRDFDDENAVIKRRLSGLKLEPKNVENRRRKFRIDSLLSPGHAVTSMPTLPRKIQSTRNASVSSLGCVFKF